MKRLVSLWLAGVATLVVAGCSTESAGQPTTTGPSASSESSTSSADNSGLPHSGAPSVANPLPKAALEGDPCEALTVEQVQYVLGDDAPQGKKDDTQLGPQCDWQDSVSSSGFLVGFDTAGQGLSDVYANTKPKSSSFEELSAIAGFPAVQYRFAETQQRACTTGVGLANEYSITVDFSMPPEKVGEVQPCEVSSKLADMVVGNLKQKAGK